MMEIIGLLSIGGKIAGSHVVFERMGLNTCYIALAYDSNGNAIPISKPFLASASKHIQFIEPDTSAFRTIRLNRKYPLGDNVFSIRKKITGGIQEKKGKNIVIADLSSIDDTICNYFVICQGNSPSQVTAIVDSVKDYVRIATDNKPTAIDGLQNAQWVAMDYSDVLVHVFLPEVRDFYNLEHLWADAKLTYLPDLD